MVWVRIDDHFSDHPKMVAAGPLGLAMQVAGLCYSNRHLTDGFIPQNVAKKLLDFDDIRGVAWKGVVKRLVDAGAWKVVPGGWQIHDYAEYQPTRSQVEADRIAAKERMQTMRAKRRGGSPDVRANNPRTDEPGSPELRRSFARSSPYPGPVPDVPTERTRAHARDPTPKTQPPVFNGNTDVPPLAEASDPETTAAQLAAIRRQLTPTEQDTP
jgi:hypothetical protein